MNAYQPRTAPSYAYDITDESFQGTGAPIFGYDFSANYIPPTSLEISLRPMSQFRQFTGKERDSESGLDYFGARYYGSALGRFTSPDWSTKPEAVPYATLSDPQSLNLYAYGRNNPVTNRDLDGHWCLFGHGTTCSPDPPPPTGKIPPPPGAPAMVDMNGHKVSDPKVTKALAAISIYMGSATVNVTSGDRDFVPAGGAKNSEHLQGKAADFHVVGMTDSKADTELKDGASPIADGYRLIQHGPDTQTQGAHLHLDSKNADGNPTVFMHEGMTPAQKGTYSNDNPPPQNN
jgi:RHS repeat-associated protein